MRAPDSVVELLQALVRIPSVNPSGTPGTAEVGEQRCAEFLLEHLRGLGAEAELRAVLPGRPNVVARFPSDRPGKPRLLFAPHTDTVSVAGMTIDPFGGEVRDGKLWGRGASDTKGSMASMLWALGEKRDSLATLGHEIWFAGLCGEEAGQQGAKALAAEERFDFVIAGEPTGLDIVHLHKGCTHLLLRAHGKAVHAARLELGENAIEKMMDALQWVRAELRPTLAACTHPVLGPSTVSIGTIDGGSKINIVPDLCEAAVDIRTVPGADCAAVLAGVAAQLGQRVPGLEVTLTQSPPLDTPREHPVIGVLESLGARCVGAPWFCDAAVFARQGVAAVAMGPGSIDQAHTKDEWIAIAELERGAEFFGRFLAAL
jgi:acetylornithine deacetylase/succinyl-diaminopimelate desuccinylase-like protein